MTEAYFSRTLGGRLKKGAASLFLPSLRRWDRKSGQRPDAFMANSRFVAHRIERIYGRASTVVYPPVDVERFTPKNSSGGEYFVTLGRLVPYKNIGRIAEAFDGLSHKLVVVGDGPGARDLERTLRGKKNVEWLRRVTDSEWGVILGKARAFLFMAEEDFGIAPVEAQAAGVPVIAWGKGGILETVRGLPVSALQTEEIVRETTGLFYWEPTPEALKEAIESFVQLEDRIDPGAVRRNAERFSSETFRERYGTFVRDAWSAMARGKGRWFQRAGERILGPKGQTPSEGRVICEP